ncbi:RabGAP/TBC [Aureobasidium sp. EXF-10728]|nr:RabGAP/TBC [Aureobasidium sp. EXF-10728]
MAPTASINAVLANQHYHQQREDTPDSPVSPSQPTTPQFSWPRRVRSPEPHLPLRKASPERLRQRMPSLPTIKTRQKPAPLFITTNAGQEALGPFTSGSIAPPHSSRVNVKSNKWWEDTDDEKSPARRRNFSAVEPRSRPRELSMADATLSRQGSWPLEDSPTSMAVPETDRNETRTSYRSQMTSTSSHMGSTTGTARSSVATADSSVSDCVKIDYADDDEDAQDNMTDYEDDLLDMYIAGFGTPVNLSVDLREQMRKSMRLSMANSRTNSFLHAPKSSVDTLGVRPGTSPSSANDTGGSHRRSHSASMVDRKSILADANLTPFDRNNKPTLFLSHNRTSTQILSGRVLPDPPLSAPPPTVDPSPVLSPITDSPVSSSIPLPPSKPVPRDRYGFKKSSLHISVQDYDVWQKEYNLHLDRRRAKWNILMKQFGYTTENPTRFPTKSEKIKRYVRKGIPPDWRGAAWFWYAGGPKKLAEDPGLYWNLLKQVNQGALSDNDREHIERDLNRTFPDNDRFKPDDRPTTSEQSRGIGETENETSMIKALRRVLQAFAVHNPNIGYCQSLNFIAGLLLLFLNEDEEKAFILLNVVTTEHLPGTHGVALEGANIDIAVLMTSIKESLPSIWAKLDDKPTTPAAGGVPRLPTVSLATTAWFMSLFVGTLPIECVLRVWDCLFFEGSKTLFRVALAIFKSSEQTIKAVSDPMEIFQLVQSLPRGMLDANALMETCFRKRGGFGGLSQDVVEKRREEGRVATRSGRTLTVSSGDVRGRGGEGDALGRRSFMRAKSKTRFSRRQTKGA